jgi:Arc/MetJ-type ribon-helix-helix transcriptional regulator
VNTIKIITLHLPEPYLKALDTLVDQKYYPHRAEAIRIAIRDLLNDELWMRTETNPHV